LAGNWVGGELVRAFRERRGLSQEELAELAGVSDRTIRNVESGTRRPRRDTVERLVAVLELHGEDRDALVDGWAGDRRPCSLPTDIPDFVGRTDALGAVRRILSDTPQPGVSRVCVLAAMGGVGKTTLAVHLAHELAERYPDGQLYLDLRGSECGPVEPADALARLLGRLGVPAGQLPSNVDGRAEVLRDRLAGRRLLLVLDDAAGEAQVRPLLPGTAGSAVVVTSRNRLSGLSGAHLVELGVFDHEEALALLRRVVGPARGAEPRAAAVVDLCGRLPLAVRVVAALLAGRPQWSVAHVADLLADERQRLSVLAAGDLCVEAGISLSYQALPPETRCAFRLLGVLDAPDFAAWAASAVLEVPVDAARRVVETLVDAYLLEIARTDEAGQVRYRFHDLVRAYARHQGADRPGAAERVGAVERAAVGWLSLVVVAVRGAQALLTAASPSELTTTRRWAADERVAARVAGDPLPWLDAEHGAVVAIARQAVAAGQLAVAADLCAATTGYASLRCDFTGSRAMAEAVAAAAHRTGDATIEASATLTLADGFAEQGELTRARPLAASALATARDNGLRRLEVRARLSLAIIDRSTGALDAARAEFDRALDAAAAVDDRLGRAYALSELGAIQVAQGEYDEAERCYHEARAVFRDEDETRGETKTVLRLAILDQSRGDTRRAGTGYREALELAERCGDSRGASEIRYRLGLLHLANGELATSTGFLRAAAADSERDGDARGLALANDALARVYAQLGDVEAARELLGVAIDYYRRVRLDTREEDARRRLAAMR